MIPTCPTCNANLHTVRPVRIRSDPDSPRWVGHAPEAIGFACLACTALLPLTVAQRGDVEG